MNSEGSGNPFSGFTSPSYDFGGDDFYDDDKSVDYLDYDIKGRPTHERMFGYAGSMFLTGLTTGGIYGAQQGLRNAPSPKFWIRLNSLMNGAGKYGSKWGNNLGMISLLYAFNESMAEQFDVAGQLNLPPAANNAIGGCVTGLFYKCTAAPRTAALAGFLGGVGGYGMYHLSEMRNRFRF